MSGDKKRYRKVRVDFFRHPRTRGLGAIAKLLMIFLTTRHQSGLTVMSINQMRIGIDEELPSGLVEAALAELVAAELVVWDEEYEVVWVVEALDEQVGTGNAKRPNPNMAKSVFAHIDTLPPSSLVRRFLDRYGDWLRRSGVEVAQADAGRNLELFPRGVDQRQQLRLVTHEEDAPAAPPPAPGPESPPDSTPYDSAEAQIRAALEEAMPGSNVVEMARKALDLWAEGEATVGEIVRVIEWWSRNRSSCWLPQCFVRFGPKAKWATVSAAALGRNPSEQGRRSRSRRAGSHRGGIDDARAAYAAAMDGDG